jgi:hypothetical protein
MQQLELSLQLVEGPTVRDQEVGRFNPGLDRRWHVPAIR